MASPFCFRPSPEDAALIDEDAKALGLSRAAWLSEAAREKLHRNRVEAEEIRGEVAQIVAPPAGGSARADAFRAASLRRLGR